MKNHIEDLREIESILSSSISDLCDDSTAKMGFYKLGTLAQYIDDQIELLKYFGGLKKDKSHSYSNDFCCRACQNEG